MAAFEDAAEEEAERVRKMLPRSLAERHPSVEQAAQPKPPDERKPLPYLGED